VPSRRFPKTVQLTHNREYQRIYAGRTSVTRGPLRVTAVLREDTGSCSRIGLSVPGRVGTNVKRNRIKRRIREAFRLHRDQLPPALDMVVAVHPHDERTVDEYAAMLMSAAAALAETWAARAERHHRG